MLIKDLNQRRFLNKKESDDYQSGFIKSNFEGVIEFKWAKFVFLIGIFMWEREESYSSKDIESFQMVLKERSFVEAFQKQRRKKTSGKNHFTEKIK